MASGGGLHSEALSSAVSAVAKTADWSDGDRWDVLADESAAEADERLRRLALAALVAAAIGASRGWDDDRLARLEAFRADRSPLVAGVAQFTFPDESVELTEWL